MSSPSRQAGNAAHAQFIERHRPLLLRYLDGTAPAADEPDALGYVDRVLNEWQERFGGAGLAAATAEERTFWYALYQLEELAENGHGTVPEARGGLVLAYEHVMMDNLAEVRELLRRGRPLPADRFMASRPDGT